MSEHPDSKLVRLTEGEAELVQFLIASARIGREITGDDEMLALGIVDKFTAEWPDLGHPWTA